MKWHNKIVWIVGISATSIILLLLLTQWIPIISPVSAHITTLENVTSIGTASVQSTPSVDPTMTALEKEHLSQEVNQLKQQNERSLTEWFWNNASIFFSTLIIVLGALVGYLRWLGDRRGEQGKRDEERFQSVVEGLGGESVGAKVGAAIMLRTFLRPGYKRFYSQTFDLAIAHLRLRNVDVDTPEPLDSLAQALATVFKESFPLVRESLGSRFFSPGPQLPEARGVQLDKTHLARADLRGIRMARSHFRGANLFRADLRNAYLRYVDFSDAYMREADLKNANLVNANLENANLEKVYFVRANLTGANLTGANPDYARSLKGTKMFNVIGLTEDQLKVCNVKGAEGIVIKDDLPESVTSTILNTLKSREENALSSPPLSSQEVNTFPIDHNDIDSGSVEL